MNQPGIQHCLSVTDKAFCDLASQLNLKMVMQNIDTVISTVIYESPHPRVAGTTGGGAFTYTVSFPNIFYYLISFDLQTTVTQGKSVYTI